MSENLKKFLEIIANDAEMAKKLSTNNSEDVSEKINIAISLAKEKGIDLVEKDFEVMSENDLKAASGGYETPKIEGLENQQSLDGGVLFVPVFLAVNANIAVNANAAVNVTVDANANINVNANYTTNANVSD